MFNLHLVKLERGAVPFSLILAIVLIAATLSAAAINRNNTTNHLSHPGLQAPIDPACTSSLACIEYDNNGAGPAIRGIGLSGQGIVGLTRHNSTAAANGTGGVVGTDASTSGTFNFGVNGFSSHGVGVAGGSSNGTGVRGVSTSSVGVSGVSNGNSVGVSGSSTRGIGVSGLAGKSSDFFFVFGGGGVTGDSFSTNGVSGASANSNGVAVASRNGVGGNFFSTNAAGILVASGNSDAIDATTEGTASAGVVGGDTINSTTKNNVGVEGVSIQGTGVLAEGGILGANVMGGLNDTSTGFFNPALSVVGDDSKDLIDACPSGVSLCHTAAGLAPAVFQLDQSGNVTIAGKIFTAGSCSLGCSPTSMSSEKRVRFYTPSESLPTVEDFGEAQLVAGQANVRIDPAFANTMDQQVNYLVFITPEGDSRGLYVTAKTPLGFEVRENQGGRSTLAFSYRIVAKPYGDRSIRLQMFAVAKPGPPRPPKLRGNKF